MIGFAVLAVLFVAIALAFLLPPLLRARRSEAAVSRGAVNVNVYRDQLAELEHDLAAGTLDHKQYDEARREIERRLLDDAGDPEPAAPAAPVRGKRMAVAAGIAAPVLAVALYLLVGNPAGLAPERVAGDAPVTQEQIEAMVAGLAARLKADPENVEGWAMLGRSYMVLERFKDAAAAYAHAVKRVPDNPQLLVDYADALAMAQGRDLSGEPEKLIARALAVDPDNLKALALAGTVAFQNKEFAKAVAHWQRMLNLAPPESEMARAIQGSIAEAQAQGKLAAAPAKRARVQGSVSLAPDLAARAAPSDVVFIFARAAEGPRIPLAVLRKRVADLPVKFELDDSMAMAPGMSLSGFDRVIVGARVSKSANPVAQSGDLEGLSAAVQVGAAGVTVVIDKVVP